MSFWRTIMWITGMIDLTLEKNELFTMLCKEIRTLAPGARLSYNLRSRLEWFSKEDRKEIASNTLKGCAPLFVACQSGNAEVVEYLITTCDADVEQKGLYEVSEDHSLYHVTPLWCAAVAGKLAVVKCLIQHGADVNSVSDTGSTPVRSACFMTHFDIVTFLVENGANINKPNSKGGACLINSIQSVALCEYLIKNGANVNAQDIQNNTALHYAIEERRCGTTKLLLEHGAKSHLKNKYNDDALQTACIRGAKEIFECLIEMCEYDAERVAGGYELLGSTFLDENHDMQFALECWRKAANVRLKHNLEKQVKAPRKAFQFVKEFRNLEELETISCDQDLVRIQSLLICERILGTSHKDMIFRLRRRGAAYADSLQYQNCINLWLDDLKLKIYRDTILFSDTCLAAQSLVLLYLDMIEKYNSGQIANKVSFEDAYETLELISSDLPISMRALTVQPVYKEHKSNFDIMLKVLMNLIYILHDISLTAEQEHKVIVIVCRILCSDPRTYEGGFSLLQLSTMKSNEIFNPNIEEDGNKIKPFPSIKVYMFLMKCVVHADDITLLKRLRLTQSELRKQRTVTAGAVTAGAVTAGAVTARVVTARVVRAGVVKARVRTARVVTANVKTARVTTTTRRRIRRDKS